MHRVIVFLVVNDSEAAKKFYRDTLQLKFLHDDGFAMVFDIDGVTLRINTMPGFIAAQHTVLGWRSKDIAADVKDLAGKGISFNRYPGLTQDELDICTFPNGDKVAWFCDPSGNVLSLSQHAQE